MHTACKHHLQILVYSSNGRMATERWSELAKTKRKKVCNTSWEIRQLLKACSIFIYHLHFIFSFPSSLTTIQSRQIFLISLVHLTKAYTLTLMVHLFHKIKNSPSVSHPLLHKTAVWEKKRAQVPFPIYFVFSSFSKDPLGDDFLSEGRQSLLLT